MPIERKRRSPSQGRVLAVPDNICRDSDWSEDLTTSCGEGFSPHEGMGNVTLGAYVPSRTHFFTFMHGYMQATLLSALPIQGSRICSGQDVPSNPEERQDDLAIFSR
ncbi:hypothetical protein N7536_010567 [Penicillium majusculum]|nr:hypothetical protein N7536_010567 [Penicillium majusculum]